MSWFFLHLFFLSSLSPISTTSCLTSRHPSEFSCQFSNLSRWRIRCSSGFLCHCYTNDFKFSNYPDLFPRFLFLIGSIVLLKFLLGMLLFSLQIVSLTPWTVAHQAPLSMWFSRQGYWSGRHFLLQGIFPTQGSCLLLDRWILYHWATWDYSIILLRLFDFTHKK